MEDLVLIFKALSDKTRLRIVSALMRHDELCACQIIELIQLTGASVSRHLSLLISAKLLESRKEGRWVYYRFNQENKEHLISWIESKLKEDAQQKADFKALDRIISSELDDLCRKQRGSQCC